MSAGLKWGCPFVLYWEMYNNEIDKDGRQRGFWLIDDRNVPQPVYRTHHEYYQWGRSYVAAYLQRTGHVPTDAEFRNASQAFFRRPGVTGAN